MTTTITGNDVRVEARYPLAPNESERARYDLMRERDSAMARVADPGKPPTTWESVGGLVVGGVVAGAAMALAARLGVGSGGHNSWAGAIAAEMGRMMLGIGAVGAGATVGFRGGSLVGDARNAPEIARRREAAQRQLEQVESRLEAAGGPLSASRLEEVDVFVRHFGG